MLKKRIINWIIIATLLVAAMIGIGIVAGELGLSVTTPAYASATGSSGGGGG